MEILKNLKKLFPLLIFLCTALILFNINYYMMANFPGSRDRMCVIGAGLTTPNIIFSTILSILTGLFAATIFTLFKEKVSGTKKSSITSTAGFIGGSLTVFCTLCTIPVITFFGLSLSLNFFTTYDLPIKVLSTILMLFGLYFANRQLKHSCSCQK